MLDKDKVTIIITIIIKEGSQFLRFKIIINIQNMDTGRVHMKIKIQREVIKDLN